MRDSLSLLDQLTVSFEDKITHKDEISLLGIPDNESLKSIPESRFHKRTGKMRGACAKSRIKGDKPQENGPGT